MLLTVMTQNIRYGAATDGRWQTLADTVRDIAPHLLLLQEADHLTDRDALERAEKDLGMRLVAGPSRNLPCAVAWNPRVLELIEVETQYWQELHHGYCAPRFTLPTLDTPPPAPLVAISAHLTPYSATLAAQEAALLVARVWRHHGLGLIGGDINHLPADDPEPDWTTDTPYHRAARCHQRTHTYEPWRGNRIVGRVLRDGDLTDVAAAIAARSARPDLLAPTAHAGAIRTDQQHLTPALAAGLLDYRILPAPYSDHDATLSIIDTSKIVGDKLLISR